MATMVFLCMLSACGKDAVEAPQTAEEDWTPTVTRGDGNGGTFNQDIRISAVTSLGNLSSEPAFSDVYWATENKWAGTTHSWGTNTALHLIATTPTDYNGTGIPTTVMNGDTTPLMAGYLYQANKPTENISFTMKHLMGQLQVHIKIAGNETKDPKNTKLRLYNCKSIDYEKLEVKAYGSGDTNADADTDAAVSGDLALGTFTKDDTGSWVNTAQVIIPQTLAKGVQCLTFKVGNATYTFTPENDIVLTQGKKTHLYLGVAYDEKVIQIGNGVSVEDWNSGTAIGSGEEATEEKNKD